MKKIVTITVQFEVEAESQWLLDKVIDELKDDITHYGMCGVTTNPILNAVESYNVDGVKDSTEIKAIENVK